MPSNSDTRLAMEYHQGTKHSDLSLRMSRHFLDWESKPRPFKVYTKLPSIALPRDFPRPELDALTSTRSIEPSNHATTFDIGRLAELLFFSAGLTREVRYPFGSYYMRAAPATGALYPIEVYVICMDVPGLKAGVYHFGPGDFALTELWAGDYRGELAAAAGGNHRIMSAPVTIAFTSIAWRNAWKYEARSYRHWFWDSGVIAANLLSTAVSSGLPAHLILGFVDAQVNRLLCLDEQREAAVALAPIGIGSAHQKKMVPTDIHPVKPEVLPLSKKETRYPEIWKIHEASSLASVEEVMVWAKATNGIKQRATSVGRSNYPLQPLKSELSKSSLREVILLRGSARRFTKVPVSFEQLSTTLRSSTRGVPMDFLRQGDSILELYLIVNAVEGLPSGAYFFDRQADSLEQLKIGEFRKVAGHLCLDQSLFANASVVFFLMSDLNIVLKHFGNRGYRAAQFEAGIVAGKIYLSTYAQGLGASGSTFYDDAVTEFFSPHARDKSTMIATGIGFPDYEARPGKILVGMLSKTQLLTEGASD